MKISKFISLSHLLGNVSPLTDLKTSFPENNSLKFLCIIQSRAKNESSKSNFSMLWPLFLELIFNNKNTMTPRVNCCLGERQLPNQVQKHPEMNTLSIYPLIKGLIFDSSLKQIPTPEHHNPRASRKKKNLRVQGAWFMRHGFLWPLDEKLIGRSDLIFQYPIRLNWSFSQSILVLYISSRLLFGWMFHLYAYDCCHSLTKMKFPTFLCAIWKDDFLSKHSLERNNIEYKIVLCGIQNRHVKQDLAQSLKLVIPSPLS